tara:strand:- start:4937 stop:5092 length:156 start_codon:yes stop_codon:yes gene_type:complete
MIILDDIDDSEFYDTQYADDFDLDIITDADDGEWFYLEYVEQRLVIYLNDI